MSRDSQPETSVERVDPLVGAIFDKRFRVEERLAAGGFGAIYRATHVKSGHQIALKVLLPSLAQDLGVVARFRREGDTLTALRNPHTINAYELGQAADRTLFITMELLHGVSLFERYRAEGPFEWKRMLRIARQVCDSLEEAHAMGVVHRDLKPTNIHLETRGDDRDYVKVLDFGIAKIIGGGDFDAADLTNAGQMVGTLDYMSPEQMIGGAITGQTDIYTLGIVMYEMIAGAPPFGESMTAAQALASLMKTTPEPLYLRAPVPEELDRIVMRCLARETAQRYATVVELRADIDQLLAGTAPGLTTNVETRPVEKEDEATVFTPVPEPLVAQSRRVEWPAEPTTTEAPPAALLAQTRRARRPSDEHTAFTPPPQSLLDGLRREAAEGSVTAPRSLAPPSIPSESDMTTVMPPSPVPPRTLTPPRSATPHSVPIIGPLPTHDTPLPQIVAAPFSPPRPPCARRSPRTRRIVMRCLARTAQRYFDRRRARARISISCSMAPRRPDDERRDQARSRRRTRRHHYLRSSQSDERRVHRHGR